MGESERPVVYTVTSARSSTTDNQAERMRRYLTMMGIRVGCFALLFVTSGWMRWVCVVGAVALPYFAVVIANAVRPPQQGRVEPVTPPLDRTRQLGQ
ncbi:MAG TPA: DUF3099 domain-containing protein [Intrasporangium sp.]|uniref:DUF3099 domain-containing protein n=1 Tax=Intrasporangium sp. TaxID=1925024 RepID=UPI002D7A1AC0|nr:DUF3099 domain-containing protein [Intrasporangium sp.]HET7398079.1 DUF3099 domain-containing protein [Intrasporangium sp.]